MINPAFVLGGGINGLWIARSLGRRSIPVYLFSSFKKDIAYCSRYVTMSQQFKDTDPKQVIKQLRKTSKTLGCKPVLFYTSDYFLRLVSSHKDELKEFCIINLPSEDAVETVIDKGRFNEFCSLHELPAPRSWVPETSEQFDACVERINFPAIIKPVVSHTAQGIFKNNGVVVKMILVRNATELTNAYSQLTGNGAELFIGAELLIQEYIEGVDSEHYSYCSYRNLDSKELVGFGIRKIRLSPIHGGIGSFVEISNDNELVDEARNALDKLHYKGVSSVCFKRNALTGRLMLHEINGRFPMCHSASLLCRIDLSYIVYQDIIGAPLRVPLKAPGRGKWITLQSDIGSFYSYRNAGEISVYQWLKSLTQVHLCAEYTSDDLRPFVFSLKSMLRKLLSRTLGVFWSRGTGSFSARPE